MGKVTRWFRGVLGMKKDKVNIDNSNAKTKKRWIFGKCMKDMSQRVTVENDSTRMRSCMSASEKEQNKHAIAVAATTTDVAGAQAALAVSDLASAGLLYLVGSEIWGCHQDSVRLQRSLGLGTTFNTQPQMQLNV
ncbi:hypothetical protein Tco_0792750 [Tanacetum coccineum]